MSITATHIGTKLIAAEPMTRAAYNEFRGWALPADENGADDGFLVESLDGGQQVCPMACQPDRCIGGGLADRRVACILPLSPVVTRRPRARDVPGLCFGTPGISTLERIE